MSLVGRLRLGAIVVLLLATAYVGVFDGVNAVHEAGNRGQWAATISQIVYGIVSIVALIGMILGARWVTVTLVVWAVVCTVTAGLAPVVWGLQPVLMGVGSAVAGAVLTALAVWGWRAHERTRTPGPARSS